MFSWLIYEGKRLARPKRRIYLDAAATTPVRPEVLAAMDPFWRRDFGNPAALYKEGVTAQRALIRARTKIARTLYVRAEEITFTSGGTEANNLAIMGVVTSHLKRGRKPETLHVITTKLEHSSILACVEELERIGVRVTYAPVKSDGRVDLQAFEAMLTPETVLVSVHLVNNEIGVIQPLRDVARRIAAYKALHPDAAITLHTDASQAPLFLDCSPERLGVNLLTLDGQKVYGPKGIGFLFHQRKISLEPIIRGGGQEGGLRSGTEPLPLIVGLAEALVIAAKEREATSARIQLLRDRFVEDLRARIPQMLINGGMVDRIPNNVNISIPAINTEFLTIHLDKAGIAVATKSACLRDEPGSLVVSSLGYDAARSESTLRLTLGLYTTGEELERAAETIGRIVVQLDKK